MRQDHVGTQRDQLFREWRILIRASGCKTVLDLDVAALRPSALGETDTKCREASFHLGVVLGVSNQHTNAWHPHGFLRPRRERPRGRAAEQRDELAALHSITSSARASTAGGTVRPNAFAIFKLMTISIFVENSIGRSPGFAPFKIL